jgi:DNA modification methylase
MVHGDFNSQKLYAAPYIYGHEGESMNYDAFLKQKEITDVPTGIDSGFNISPMLFDFQRDIVIWALKRGRAAIFADCGLGKTPMQLEWARHIPGNVLILAPLAVAQQTIREGGKFGVTVNYCRKMEDVKEGITITNYEMLNNFDPDYFAGIVLDESSILKSFTGKFRTMIIEKFDKTPFRLACTATPAPNDYMELGNHSEFLGVMGRNEMLSMFFVHDGGDTAKWRLKGHAQDNYWKWLCSWAVMIRKPSDLGYDDKAFILPSLNIHAVECETPNTGFSLFAKEAQTLQERISARRETIDYRVQKAADIVNSKPGYWMVWCNLNNESDALKKAIPDSVEVKGSDSVEFKEKALLDFSRGDIRILISKPSIAGFGMNFQHCSNVAFVGLSDSYEAFYQAVRRCWRFGQTNEVDCHIITADTEGAVVSNIKRKEKDAMNMADNMVKHMHVYNEENIKGMTRDHTEYKRSSASGENWTLHLGDCVEVTKELDTDSVHYTIFSPPFASLYTYSNSDRDMGNSKNPEEFFKHFEFLVKELYRVTIPGRLLSFHCFNIPSMKERDGVIGLKDFRGDMIRLFQNEGWIYHSEVCIWKDPVTAMQRTKALGLLYKQIKKDSAMCRQGIPDYLVTMRKPGDNPERVTHDEGNFPCSLWQKYASPVWMDINPSDTLQYMAARESNDERHICPLQLEPVRRAVKLWTNEGDVVLSPFAGIGSEGFVSLEMGRKFIGIELKESYWRQAKSNLESAQQATSGLFGCSPRDL